MISMAFNNCPLKLRCLGWAGLGDGPCGLQVVQRSVGLCGVGGEEGRWEAVPFPRAASHSLLASLLQQQVANEA